MTGARYQAVVLDLWNTLIGGPTDAIRAAQVAAIGTTVLDDKARPVASPERWSRAYAETEAVYKSALFGGRFFDPREEGTRYLAEQVGLRPTVKTRRRIFAALVEGALVAPLEISPGVSEFLELSELLGTELFLVSDSGMVPAVGIRGIFQRLKWSPYFTGYAFSDEVMAFKPAAELYESLSKLRTVAPERILAVGDTRRTDILGGNRRGYATARFTAFYDDTTALGDEGAEQFRVSNFAALGELITEQGSNQNGEC